MRRHRRSSWVRWAIGLAYLFICSVGAYDQVMTLRGDSSYFRLLGYTDRQIAYFADYPLVPRVLWIVAVWAGLIGAVLLLVRPHHAASPLVLAAACQLLLDVVTFATRVRWAVFGAAANTQALVILVIACAVAAYAGRLRRARPTELRDAT